MDGYAFCKTKHPADEQQSYETAIAENPANGPASRTGGRKKRGIVVRSRLWKPGRTLHIAFKKGTPKLLQDKVMSVARQWLAHANLKFELIDMWDNAEIRVVLHPYGTGLNSSAIGTDALLDKGATMELSPQAGDEFNYCILHEFGHALGLDHEHQHPDSPIIWNLTRLFAFAEKKGVSDADIEKNFLTLTERPEALTTPYDMRSVMHYKIPAELTLQDFTAAGSNALSEGDKAMARLAYPGKALD